MREIKIYTITGQLVRTLSAVPGEAHLINRTVNGSAEWDGTNDFGSAIAMGTYVFLAKDGRGNKKTGKIGVIR